MRATSRRTSRPLLVSGPRHVSADASVQQRARDRIDRRRGGRVAKRKTLCPFAVEVQWVLHDETRAAVQMVSRYTRLTEGGTDESQSRRDLFPLNAVGTDTRDCSPGKMAGCRTTRSHVRDLVPNGLEERNLLSELLTLLHVRHGGLDHGVHSAHHLGKSECPLSMVEGHECVLSCSQTLDHGRSVVTDVRLAISAEGAERLGGHTLSSGLHQDEREPSGFPRDDEMEVRFHRVGHIGFRAMDTIDGPAPTNFGRKEFRPANLEFIAREREPIVAGGER